MPHHFKKQFGQNFLRHDRFAEALVDSLEMPEGSHVLEIGPGDGRVTQMLLNRGHHVTAIEVDYDLIPKLIKRFSDNDRFSLVHEDFLELDLTALRSSLSPILYVIGSLPYNISKQIIYKLLHSELPIVAMSFIVQLEVAKEYAALAPEATFLSNWVRLYGDVRKLQTIPASQFFPQPKVDGAILRVRMASTVGAGHGTHNREYITSLLRTGFSQPRKTLRNNLISGDRWSAEQVDKTFVELELIPTTRPAEIKPEVWVGLASALK